MDNSPGGRVDVVGGFAWAGFHIAGNEGREVESYKADMGMAHCKPPFPHWDRRAWAWDTSCLVPWDIAVDHTGDDDRAMHRPCCPCSMEREIHIYSP